MLSVFKVSVSKLEYPVKVQSASSYLADRNLS
jgi:hypothetical protein